MNAIVNTHYVVSRKQRTTAADPDPDLSKIVRKDPDPDL